MALRREITARITDLLRKNPQGLSITEIVKSGGINRNTAGRYLDNLLVSGQVEMRHFGMAKIYSLSRRLPVSSVLAISSELVMQLDGGLRIVFLNRPFIDLLGTSEKELVGKNIEFSRIPLFFDETFPRVLAWLHEGLSGTEFRGELEIPSQERIFFCRIAPTVFNNGQKGVSVLFEDITRRKHNETLLRESEARLRSIIHVAPIGIGVVADRMLLEVNDQVCRMTGYDEGELVGQPARKLYLTREEYDRVGNVKYGQIRKTGIGSVETQWQRKDGTIIGVLLSSTPLNPADPGAGITFTALDITERQRAENALRENEEKFRTLFNNANDMITLHGFGPDGLPGQYIEVNDAACRRLKYTRIELLAMSPKDIVAPESSGSISTNAQKLQADGHATFEMVHLTKDRQRIPVEISAHLFEFHGKPMVLALVRDITGRINAERERRENEQKYRFIAEHSVDIINRQTPECLCTYTSPSVTTLLGYTEREVLGKSMLALVHPDDLPGVMRDIAMCRSNGQDTLISVFRFRHKEGHYIWFESTTRIVRDEAGQIKEFLNISRDITGRKSAERKPAGTEPARICSTPERFNSPR